MNNKKQIIVDKIKKLELKKNKLKEMKTKIIKSIYLLNIEEKELRSDLKKFNQSNRFIVSIGFDKRWSCYNCIIKFRKLHFSIYLGNEKKIKKLLQQFHQDNIKDRRIEDIKIEIKQIVSSVTPTYLKQNNTKNKLSFKKIIDLYVERGEWNYWRPV